MLTCATLHQHRLVAVAVHEAGHVVGLEHGRRVGEVWVRSGAGCVVFHDDQPLTSWQQAQARARGDAAPLDGSNSGGLLFGGILAIAPLGQ
jgi:hypothetical protein